MKGLHGGKVRAYLSRVIRPNKDPVHGIAKGSRSTQKGKSGRKLAGGTKMVRKTY